MVDHALFSLPLAGGIFFFGIIGLLIWQRRQKRVKQLFPQPVSFPSYHDRLPQLEKELSRARRLKRPLSVVVIRIGTPFKDASTYDSSQTEFLLCGPVFGRALRDIDCATYDGTNKQYVIVLPETTKAQAIQPVKRLNNILGEKVVSRLVVGLSEFPSDGLCLEDLVSACGDDVSPGINYAPMSSQVYFAQAVEKKSGSNLTMTKRPRRNHGAAFKPKEALEAIKGEQTLAELDMHRLGSDD